MSGQLQRLAITFEGGTVTVRALYRRGTDGAPNPGTAARRREVTTLVRTGLEQALRWLEAGDVADLGTSGYEVREDVIGLPAASSDARKLVKEGGAM